MKISEEHSHKFVHPHTILHRNELVTDFFKVNKVNILFFAVCFI